jgi:hypothetical protein
MPWIAPKFRQLLNCRDYYTTSTLANKAVRAPAKMLKYAYLNHRK